MNEVKQWLFEESKTSNDGFYHSWIDIKESKNKDKLILLKNENLVVGFLVCAKNEVYAQIDYFEIHPNFRRKGLGKYFIKLISDYLLSKKVPILKLYCSPEESEKFWKGIGFVKFPNGIKGDQKLAYYKIIIETNKPIKNLKNDNKLELWDIKERELDNEMPKWSWDIPKQETDFEVPIIQPCDSEWAIKLTRNGKVIKDCMVKHFDKKNVNQTYYPPFIYLKKLTE